MPMLDIFKHFMPKPFLDRLGDLVPGHVALNAFPRLEDALGHRRAAEAAR